MGIEKANRYHWPFMFTKQKKKNKKNAFEVNIKEADTEYRQTIVTNVED